MGNKYDHANDAAKSQRQFVAFDLCEVVDVAPNSKGTIKVRPFSTSSSSEKPFTAKYRVDSYGDVNQPAVNDLAIVGYTRTTDAVVFGMWYGGRDSEAPEHEIDERVIGHRHSESDIRFKGDGTVTIQTNGTKVEITGDGDVIVNDSTTGAVTNVTAAATNSNGGITELNIERSDSVFV